MKRYSLEEPGHNAFDVDLIEGDVEVGGLLLLTAPDGATPRAYKMRERREDTLIVERVMASLAVHARR